MHLSKPTVETKTTREIHLDIVLFLNCFKPALLPLSLLMKWGIKREPMLAAKKAEIRSPFHLLVDDCQPKKLADVPLGKALPNVFSLIRHSAIATLHIVCVPSMPAKRNPFQNKRPIRQSDNICKLLSSQKENRKIPRHKTAHQRQQ